MQKGPQYLIYLGLLDLHLLGEVAVLKQPVAGGVLEVLLRNSACRFHLLMGLVGSGFRSDVVAVAVLPCCGTLNGAYVVLIRWLKIVPRHPLRRIRFLHCWLPWCWSRCYLETHLYSHRSPHRQNNIYIF